MLVASQNRTGVGPVREAVPDRIARTCRPCYQPWQVARKVKAMRRLRHGRLLGFVSVIVLLVQAIAAAGHVHIPGKLGHHAHLVALPHADTWTDAPRGATTSTGCAEHDHGSQLPVPVDHGSDECALCRLVAQAHATVLPTNTDLIDAPRVGVGVLARKPDHGTPRRLASSFRARAPPLA